MGRLTQLPKAGDKLRQMLEGLDSFGIAKLHVEICAFAIARDLVEELKSEKQPIPWGKGQRFKSHAINPDVIERMYEEKASAYLYGYAAYMTEYNELLEKAEFSPFVDKKRKH